MHFDEKLLNKVADLARLRLTPDETAKFSNQLEHILGYIDKLNQLNTQGVEPLVQPLSTGETPLRSDQVEQSIETDVLLKSAPEQMYQNYKVPLVVKS